MIGPIRGLGALALLLCLLLSSGCRDSPVEVLEEVTAAAAQDDLVAVQALFSVATQQRVERAWEIKGVRKAKGWRRLADRLTFNGKPLEVNSETIYGDFAKVMARAGAERRDYYFRKEDGLWRIELGAGLRYRRAEAAAEGDEKKKKKKDEKGED